MRTQPSLKETPDAEGQVQSGSFHGSQESMLVTPADFAAAIILSIRLYQSFQFVQWYGNPSKLSAMSTVITAPIAAAFRQMSRVSPIGFG